MSVSGEQTERQRVKHGLAVLVSAVVLAFGLAWFSPAQMPPPVVFPGGGGGGGGSGTVSVGTATQLAKYTAATTVGSQSTATFQTNGQLYVQGSAANDAMGFFSSSAGNGQGLWGRNSASGGVGLVGEGTHTGAIPFQVRAPASVTADLTQWLVNSSPVASVDAAGVGDFTGIAISGGTAFTPSRIRRSTFATQPSACIASIDQWITSDTGSALSAFCPTTDTWAYYWAGEPIVLPSPNSVTGDSATGWEWENQGSNDTVSFTSGSILMYLEQTGAAEHSLIYTDAPATPYSIEIWYESDLSGIATSGGGRDGNFGLFFRDNDDGKLIKFSIGAFNNTLAMDVSYWTDFDTIGTSGVISETDSVGGLLQNWIYKRWKGLKIEDDGTNLKFYWCWKQGTCPQFGGNLAREAHMTGGPNQWGIGAYVGDSSSRANVVSIDVQ